MSPARWQRIKQIFNEIEEYEGRAADILDSHCAGDPALRDEIESLLAGEKRIGMFERSYRTAAHNGPPDRLGPYRVESVLGEGGMGVVYLAVRDDDQYRKQVAIKILRVREPETVRRFYNEMQILANLDHPYITRLVDGGILADGRLYFVMDYVNGQRIDTYCDSKHVAVREILLLFLKVCEAVQYAHRNLIVHRDLKPGNILVTSDELPHLLDFGIAKLLAGPSPNLDETEPWQRMMTRTAASPEQLTGAPVTTASDVYSLGLLLYRLLTRVSPYGEAKELSSDPGKVIREYDPPPPSHAPGLTPSERSSLEGDLDSIVRKAIEKDPAARYTTAVELAADMERHLSGRPVLARTPSLMYRARKFAVRNRIPIAAAALFGGMVVAGVISTVWYARRAEIEHEHAERRYEISRTMANSLVFELQDELAQIPGTATAQSRLMRRASEYLDQLAAERDDDPRVQRDLATAYFRLGGIKALGRSVHLGGSNSVREATAIFGRALEIQRSLLRRNPADAELELQLTETLGALADLRRSTGDLDGALQLHREVLATRERLLAAALIDKRVYMGYRTAATLTAIGDLERMLGRTADAERSHERALDIRSAILKQARSAGDSRTAHRAVGISHEFLGYVMASREDWAAVERHHREALEHFKIAAAAHPQDPDLAREISGAREDLAEALAHRSQYAEAREQAAAARRIDESAAEADVNNAQALADLASAESRMSLVLDLAGSPREALNWELKARERHAAAIARDPDDPETAEEDTASLLHLASLQQGVGDPPGALRNLIMARERLGALIAKSPRNKDLQLLAVRLAALSGRK